MSLYLGVDGGGTKTAFVLLDSSGQELGSVTGPSTYYIEYGLPHVEQVLTGGIADLLAKTGVTAADVDYAFVAIPAYGESSADQAELDALPARALGHDRYRCGNDMVAGWAGSLAHADGINVVAGTGSLTYGERAGVSARAGGWGELFGDEGSGYWIGLEALIAFSRMSDGRVPKTSLHTRIRKSLDVAIDLDAIDVVLTQWGGSRGRIAALAPIVIAAADAKDPAAAAILDRAAAHLVDLVEATRRRLDFNADEPVPVSYSGGVFRADAVRVRFAQQLAGRSNSYELRLPRFSSHIGAALHAASLAGNPLSPNALMNLESSTNG